MTKGDTVEFQDFRHVWRQGVVQVIDEEGKIHVLTHDSFKRAPRVFVLPKKRVRRPHKV